jgi:hypothetical protein
VGPGGVENVQAILIVKKISPEILGSDDGEYAESGAT